jgi:hypothetical protein
MIWKPPTIINKDTIFDCVKMVAFDIAFGNASTNVFQEYVDLP